jgi:hypothetical protein
MTALIAESNGELYDYDDFCAESWERFSEVLGRMNVEDAMEQKWLQWVARGPSKCNLMAVRGGMA